MRFNVVLVVAEDRFGISRLPELLHRAGARVSLFGRTDCAAGASRYVQERVTCNRAEGSLARPLQSYLEHFHRARPFVILADEASLSDVLACGGEPWAQEIYPADLNSAAGGAIFRKIAFMTLAKPAGVAVPDFAICRNVSDAREAAAGLGFPLFFKRDVDCGGHGVIRVDHLDDVAGAFNALSFGGPVLTQRMVVGHHGKTEALYHRGELICAAHSYVMGTWPGPYGPSCARRFMVDPQLTILTERIGTATGFHGLAGFDWMEDGRTGRIMAIEFNGRPMTTLHLGKFAGVDFSRAMAGFLAGSPAVQQPVVPGRGPVVRMFPQDIRRCIAERDIPGLLRWLPGVSCNDIPWRDPALIGRAGMDLFRAMTRHAPRARGGLATA